MRSSPPRTQSRRRGCNEAIAFLREMLANGPKLVNEIKAQGARNEIAEETLKRAKRKLKIVHYVEGPGEPWFWSLPGKTSRTMTPTPNGQNDGQGVSSVLANSRCLL